VDHIAEGKWGGDVQARIRLRKREGREPTEEEEDEMGTPDQEKVTVADIRKAFDKGEEVSLGHRRRESMLNRKPHLAPIHMEPQMSRLRREISEGDLEYGISASQGRGVGTGGQHCGQGRGVHGDPVRIRTNRGRYWVK